ncbi:MAG: GDSL-type esterase/lipase family protein [Candidatus Didemnitutus sp.]|nr:GDSL-type esterase/lipase family protein [Candidatus Didemnitutus sp.]
MSRCGISVLLLLVSLLTPILAVAKVDAAAPRPKTEPRFMASHAAFLARAQAGPIGLLFLGDSITAGWQSAPDIWERYFGAHAPANFGIGGDATQNVLWRIENGELDGIAPRAVVLLIGTNNTAGHTAPEISAAIGKIVDHIRAKLPETKVLLLAIFPRGPRVNRDGTPDAWEKRMEVIHAVNATLLQLADGERVHWLDIGHHFLDTAGTIPAGLMPDQLHLSPAGYQVWAEAMQPTLDALLR